MNIDRFTDLNYEFDTIITSITVSGTELDELHKEDLEALAKLIEVELMERQLNA